MKILLELLELLEQKFGSLQEVKMKILQDDSEILEFLLTHKEAKERYFLDCKGHLVFKKDSFLTFLKTRILDSSYTKFSNKIGLGVNDSFLKTSEKVVLNFPFKDCVLKGGQSKDEQKIKEIFFNEILGRDEIDVLFSKKALCNFEFITLQNLRDSSRADSTKSKDSMKSPPPIDLLKALNPNLVESRRVKSVESSDFNLVDCHDLTKSSLAMTDRDASAESSSSSLRGDTSPKQSINENNLAESRRSEKAESAESLKDSANSIESAKNSNFLDCHEFNKLNSRNDGIGVDSHDWKLSQNLAETEANAQAQNATLPNFLIKGNNLLALHSLKHRKDIYGQVKLIYIDPPYNPKSDANTFSYNNNFNHSAWLTFMKNRLEIAREFLREDGIFCIAIDHNELFYLGVLCDEIFGRDNRIGLVSVETNPGGRSDSKFLATSNEFFIAYAKNIEKASINDLTLSDDELKQYKFKDEISNYKLVPLKRTGSNSTPDKRPNLCFPIYYDEATQKISLEKKNGLVEILPIGSDNIMRVWRWGKKKIMEQINDLEVKQSKGVFTISVKDRIKFSKKAKTQWSNPRYDASSYGTKYLYKFKLSDNFSYPKPIGLMEDIIELFTKEGDLILDYHAGSGTTLEAAHKMKRRWIGIEQMDYVESITKKRLEKVVEGEQGGVSKALNFTGGGSFIYLELMPLNAVYKEKILRNSSFVPSSHELDTRAAVICDEQTPSHSPQSRTNLAQNTRIPTAAKKAADKSEDEFLDEIYKVLQEKAFIDYRVDIQAMLKDKDFHALSTSEKKAILYSILDSNMDYVLYDDIEDSEYEIDKDLIALNKAFYGLK